jgi:hypothetical protein
MGTLSVHICYYTVKHTVSDHGAVDHAMEAKRRLIRHAVRDPVRPNTRSVELAPPRKAKRV